MNPPEIIHHVCHGQLSVARHYGGCKFAGASYHYCAADDTLVRMDVWQQRMHDEGAEGQAARDAEKAKWEAIQGRLL